MNYYEHHIGDYDQATAHLSAVEDGIYSRLIRRYMATERPLPGDLKAVQRLVRAHSRDEKTAVATVLAEFFSLKDGEYFQHRCDEEIARFQEKSRKAKNSADSRWNKGKQLSEQEQNDDANAYANAQRTHMQTDMLGGCEGNAPRARPQSPDTSLNKEPYGSVGRAPTCPFDEVIAVYHDVLPELPRVRLQTAKRKTAIGKMWRWVLTSRKGDGTRRAETPEQALAWLRDYFGRARENDFLMGRGFKAPGHEGWKCDLDFLLTERGMSHVIEKTTTRAAA